MKKTIVFFALVLAVIMSVTACSGSWLTKDYLCGTWLEDFDLDADQEISVLEYFGFEAEENAYAPGGLALVSGFEFKADGTYIESYDISECEKAFKSWLDRFMTALYNNRSALTELYGEEINDVASVDEFKDFQAYVYNFDSYKEFEDAAWAEYDDVMELSTDSFIEAGDYTLEGEEINLRANGESEYLYVKCQKISDTQMTMVFSDYTSQMRKK